MFFDPPSSEALAEGISNLPVRFSPGGLAPMCAVLSDPVSIQKQMKLCQSGGWARKRQQGRYSFGWSRDDDDEYMGEAPTPAFVGEEGLIPDTIPESVWQDHFRQQDSDLADRKELEFLLQLYKQCAGRWPVIYDRWQGHPVYGMRGKSLESLKGRLNKVVLKLMEIDLLQRRKPSTSMERLQVSQQLKYLPLFAVRFNEKHDYLRRIFLHNSFKRPLVNDIDKLVGELMRLPNLAVKKRGHISRPPTPPGPQAATASVASIQSEISGSEMTRIRAILKCVGVEREGIILTPKITRLMSVVEKEAAILLMMRDSLQRKKQELEILRSGGGNGPNSFRHKGTIPGGISSSGPVTASQTSTVTPVPATSPVSAVVPAIIQQKRKR